MEICTDCQISTERLRHIKCMTKSRSSTTERILGGLHNLTKTSTSNRLIINKPKTRIQKMHRRILRLTINQSTDGPSARISNNTNNITSFHKQTVRYKTKLHHSSNFKTEKTTHKPVRRLSRQIQGLRADFRIMVFQGTKATPYQSTIQRIDGG